MSFTRQSLGGIESVLDVAKSVVEDPCLIPVSQMVLRIHAIRQQRVRAAKPLGAAAAPPPAKGIGLCNVQKPLKMALWAYERPWVVPVGAIAVAASLVGVGYLIGRRK